MDARKLDARRLAPGVALALMLGLAACGGSGKDEQAIRDRVNTFDNAMAAKDPARVCASISKELKRQLTKTPSGSGGPKSCEAALRFNFILLGNAFKNLAKAKVDDVQVDGNQARATISYRGRKQRLGVAKQGGEWRITTLRLK
jgi:hypothetical protein